MADEQNNPAADGGGGAPPPPSPSPPPPPHHLERLPRVLSIQSHVAAGRVGNCAALFPLALHRLDCDAINTVSFSNHTGYPSVAGSRLSAEGLQELLAGLEKNGFLAASKGRRGYDYVLTGYVGRAETLSGIRGAIERMVFEEEEEGGTGGGEGKKRKRKKKKKSRPLVVVDPVMGDHDRAQAGSSSSSLSSSLYVPEDVPAVYRGLLPLADVVTPNAFEAEMLLLDDEGDGGEGGNGGEGDDGEGRRRRFEIVDEASAVAACSALHARGPGIVVLTSVAFPAGTAANAAADGAERKKKKTLTLYASQCRNSDSNDGDGDGEEEEESSSSRRFPAPPAGATAASPAVWRLELPRIDAPFTGTGDLLTALLLSFLHKCGGGGEGDGGEEKEGGTGPPPPRDLGWALERAAAGVRAVVDATVAGAAAEAARAAAEEKEAGGTGGGEEGPAATAALSSSYWASPRAVAARELRLVQCADALVSPRVVARAERIQ